MRAREQPGSAAATRRDHLSDRQALLPRVPPVRHGRGAGAVGRVRGAAQPLHPGPGRPRRSGVPARRGRRRPVRAGRRAGRVQTGRTVGELVRRRARTHPACRRARPAGVCPLKTPAGLGACWPVPRRSCRPALLALPGDRDDQRGADRHGADARQLRAGRGRARPAAHGPRLRLGLAGSRSAARPRHRRDLVRAPGARLRPADDGGPGADGRPGTGRTQCERRS